MTQYIRQQAMSALTLDQKIDLIGNVVKKAMQDWMDDGTRRWFKPHTELCERITAAIVVMLEKDKP